MIAYRELDEDPPPEPKPKPTPLPQPVNKKSILDQTSSLFEGETSECNYLVMAFVFGVFLLAITDTMK